jgi:hypothetical protein
MERAAPAALSGVGSNILSAMARYSVGFDNRWQESFDDLDDAVAWAREVAATGRTVEVISRRFGFARFVTGFPESEREALKARWKRPPLLGGGDGGGGPSHSHYGHAFGGHGGHGGGGGHGHGGH